MANTTISTNGYMIDTHCTYQSGSIVKDNNTIYSCTLNQTNISSNQNKFYIMQIINTSNKYIVFIRYGRIGETGTINYKDFSDINSAINFFEKQFRTKTGNSWCNKDNFNKIPGKYFLTEIECIDDTCLVVSESESEDDTKIDIRVIDFLKLISNQTYMKNTLMQLDIDAEKMPLGKITQNQIDKAYTILDTINKNLKSNDLASLSSDFYTLIPISIGRRKPPIINSIELVGKNINLLNELSQMVYGTNMVKGNKSSDMMKNLLTMYGELETTFTPLETTDLMYNILINYLDNSKGATHHLKFNVESILEVNRPKERLIYEKYSKNIKNKTLLFHGTRISNMMGILKNGLVVDPSKLGINVNITGKMFGMGLYFANSCSKSINYCGYNSSDNIACLFVSEVALGKLLKKKSSDSSLSANNIPVNYHSVWAQGQSGYKEYDCYDDGVQVPSGKLVKHNGNDYDLLYDEFIVYHEEQISLRYVIRLKVL